MGCDPGKARLVTIRLAGRIHIQGQWLFVRHPGLARADPQGSLLRGEAVTGPQTGTPRWIDRTSVFSRHPSGPRSSHHDLDDPLLGALLKTRADPTRLPHGDKGIKRRAERSYPTVTRATEHPRSTGEGISRAADGWRHSTGQSDKSQGNPISHRHGRTMPCRKPLRGHGTMPA